MDAIPPGILYLIQRAHKLAAPPVLAYLVLHYYLAPIYGAHYPALQSTWTLARALIGSLPLTLALAVLWDEVRIRVDAARRGAVMPPRLGDWSPGNIAGVIKNIREFENKYPGMSPVRHLHYVSSLKGLLNGFLGDGFDQLCQKYGGSTFNVRVLFENRVRDSRMYSFSAGMYDLTGHRR